jgi:hypothetical protein
VDSAWEQKKLEARKMLENAAESHTSGARFVGLPFDLTTHQNFTQKRLYVWSIKNILNN